jgi:hypothetical protein
LQRKKEFRFRLARHKYSQFVQNRSIIQIHDAPLKDPSLNIPVFCHHGNYPVLGKVTPLKRSIHLQHKIATVSIGNIGAVPLQRLHPKLSKAYAICA